MTTPTITDYLKYANLQMASEAFLLAPDGNPKTGLDLQIALKAGNNHASKFTETQAKEFTDPAKGWTVLDQKPNTPSGFSGTLFKNNTTNELVLSFRSTEFIDDAVRDCLATNTLEIFKTGFAWGQLADMEEWFASLRAPGGVLAGKQFSVTGYSLGGHLATAFNLLHNGDILPDNSPAIKQVVTFNGAGVGQIKTGDLKSALDYFNSLRNDSAQLTTKLFTTPELADLYGQLRTQLTWTAGTTTEQAKAATDTAITQVLNQRITSTPMPSELQLLIEDHVPSNASFWRQAA